jgi:type IV fimbrial biogenesis protein FimT
VNTINKFMPLTVTARFQSRRKSFAKGFTLIEALVAIAILGILTALAMPSFTQSIQRYRVNAIRDDLAASLQLARTAAMTRGLPVFLVRNPACAGVVFTGGEDWSCGWRIVVDSNRNGIVNAADILLQTTLVPAGYIVINGNTGATSITINQWGQLTGTGNRFSIGPVNAMATDPTSVTCITSGGRIRFVKDVWNICP